MKSGGYIALFVAIALLALALMRIERISTERNRLASNQHALLERVRQYRTSDSLNAASVERLTLERGELERHRAELTEQVKSLGIKLRRVQSIATTALEAQYEVRTVYRDTVIYRAGRIDTVRCAEYHDRWLDFTTCQHNGTTTTSIATRDSLIHVVHRVPKQWWIFRWGTKAVRLEVKSLNPHSTIGYTEYIELNSRRIWQ